MNTETSTKYRATGRRRVIAHKVDIDNYTYTLVDESGAVVDVYSLNYTCEGGGLWIMDADRNFNYHGVSDRKGDLVSSLRNWEAGGELPQ